VNEPVSTTRRGTVLVAMEGRRPDFPDYPLLPGDMIRGDEDGTWWKVAPGLAIGGFVLSENDVASLGPWMDSSRIVLADGLQDFANWCSSVTTPTPDPTPSPASSTASTGKSSPSSTAVSLTRTGRNATTATRTTNETAADRPGSRRPDRPPHPLGPRPGDAGTIPSFKVGQAVRFDEAEIEAWLEQQRRGEKLAPSSQLHAIGGRR
jgi:hypothetical protein